MTTKKKEIDWRIVCVGMLCITGLELAALSRGFNGTLLKSVLVALALGIGVTIKSPFTTK